MSVPFFECPYMPLRFGQGVTGDETMPDQVPSAPVLLAIEGADLASGPFVATESAWGIELGKPSGEVCLVLLPELPHPLERTVAEEP
jgi:hypothetical protein